MNNLKNNLNTLLKQRNISIADLERKSGLSRSSITNILVGSSKNPSARTLQILASALDLSIESLMQNSTTNFDKLDASKLKIFLETCTTTIDLLIKRNIEISIDELVEIFKEVFLYTTKKNLTNVDMNFVDWLIDKKI